MMKRLLAATLFWGLAASHAGEGPVCSLPKPDYHREASDPHWLSQAVQFHGHLGPWAAAGLRAGMSARRAVGAEGYFDVEVTVEGPLPKPPRSCFLDGVQVSTGATWGKRNVKWIEAERLVLRIKNTRSGKLAEVRPTPALLELLTSLESGPKTAQGTKPQLPDDHPSDDRHLEDLARRIARLPAEEILDVSFPPQ
jgi:formylmethanofuran dehydrogenase subunit E